MDGSHLWVFVFAIVLGYILHSIWPAPGKMVGLP